MQRRTRTSPTSRNESTRRSPWSCKFPASLLSLTAVRYCTDEAISNAYSLVAADYYDSECPPMTFQNSQFADLFRLSMRRRLGFECTVVHSPASYLATSVLLFQPQQTTAPVIILSDSRGYQCSSRHNLKPETTPSRSYITSRAINLRAFRSTTGLCSR